MGVIKVMTWNVKGTGNQIKRRRLEFKIKRDSPDILFLQETHQKSEDINRMYLKGMQVYEKAFGSSKSRGVATLISNRVQFEKNKVIADIDGRYLIITGCINEEKITLVNLYVSNVNQKDFLNKITELLQIERVGKVIIAGDFNLIRNQMDSTNPTRYGETRKMGILDNWMLQNGVVDVWREIKGNERMYTFYSKVFNSYSRIDYIFVSKNLMDNVDNMDVGIFKDSDHAELLLELDMFLEKKENCWRYDEKLYKNEEDKNCILKKWEENWDWNDNGEVNYGIVWDTMKAIFRGESIKLSSRKYKNYKVKIEEKKKLIKELENRFLVTKDRKLWEELKKLKNKQIVEDTEIVKKN